jgi:hypothetical protein
LLLSGKISASGANTLTKSGAGLLQYAGAGAANATVVSGGTLQLDGTLGTNTVTVQSAATLAGVGVIGGPVTVQSGATVAPGDSGVGTLTTGAETWNGGGTYICEINSTNAAGCDQVNIAGALNVAATTGSKFVLKLVSLTASNTPGPVANFDKTVPCTWTIASAGGGVLNFDPAKFGINTAFFSNDFSRGSFAVTVQGNALVVNYLPPPTIFLSSPTDGSLFIPPATINLAATVVTNGHVVTKVQFFNGGTLLNEDLAAPYAYAWTNVGSGPKTLSAVAVGDSGSVTSAVATVTVWNPAAPLLAAGLAGTNFTLQLTGVIGQHHRVEFADALPPLASWQVLTDIAALAVSPLNLVDPLTNGQRFYRAVSVP